MSQTPSHFTPTPYTPSSDANFTPTQGTYKELKPFRHWCQKVLPLVYDDSLSYYELLCKVVDYLNNTMEDVDTLHDDVDNLHTAYEDLEGDMNAKYLAMTSWMNSSYADLVDFVNTYFADLNVQTEINNKLDDMAEDGTLSALIEPYVQPKVNNKINSMVTNGEFADIVAPFVEPAVDDEIDDMVNDGRFKAITDPKVVQETDTWLQQNITNPSNPPLDASLTLNNAAAPAKTVGQELYYNIRGSIESLLNPKTNYFDKNSIIPNADIVSATGAIVASETYNVSDWIVMPFKSRIKLTNVSHNYAYCYDRDNAYLGRIDLSTVTTPIWETYNNIHHIRILTANADTDVMVTLYTTDTSTYIPYNANETIDDAIKFINDTINYSIRNTIGKIVENTVNFFDPNSVIPNKDIVSATGVIINSSTLSISDAIIMDFSKPIWIQNGTYTYAYCYEKDGTYLGRVDANVNAGISSTYATVRYIRVVVANTDNNVMVTYREDMSSTTYIPFNPLGDIYSRISALRSELIYSIKNEIACIINSRNYFNEKAILPNTDIVSATGKLIPSASYSTSDWIIMNFTKRVIITNSSVNYLYCYDKDDNYLGRYNPTGTGDAPLDVYPTVHHIRVLKNNTDTNVMVTYYTDYMTGYVAFNALEYVTDNKALHRNTKYGNLYNNSTRFDNTSLYSNTGYFRSDAGYFTSDKIYVDGSKPVVCIGSTYSTIYQYLYCYDSNDEFLGRIDCVNPTILNTATGHTVEYVRVCGTMNDDNSTLGVYQSNWKYHTVTPYNESLGEPLVSRRKFRIATYNCGNFSGVGITQDTEASYRVPYIEAIQSLEADIALFQYDVNLIDNKATYTTILEKLMTQGIYHGSRNYDYLGFRSNFDVVNEGTVDYDITPTPSHSYFEWIDVLIDGKPIHICNIHVEWKDNATRQEQLDEIIEHCSNYKDCIVLGDFNPEDYIDNVKQSDNLTYAADLQRFITAGFTPLNANDDLLGVVNTMADNSSPYFNGPWDNILIRGGIKFCGFNRLERTWMNDHYPVYADLMVV